MRSLLVALVFGILFLAAAFPSDTSVSLEHFERRFGPPTDYLSIEQKFVADGDYGAVINLGDFIKENPDLPQAKEIIALRDRAEQEYNSWWSRSMRLASGFLTGNTDSSQGMIGDFAANFLVYGNVRDLAKQSYNKVTGQPVDRLVVALSTVGLVADVATYFPPTIEEGAPAEAGFSLLKALKRAGAMTTDFAEKVIALAKGARTAEHMKELAACTTDVVKLYHRVPEGSIGYVMREVNTTEELEKVTKIAETAPKEVALVSTLADSDGLSELKAADASKESLTTYLRVGRGTIVRVMSPTVLAIGVAKNFLMLVHVFQGGLPDLARIGISWTCGLLAVVAFINFTRHIIAIIRPAREPVVQK